MDKENAWGAPDVHSGRITEEQRARITQNFRAAKALLARKRPHEFTPISGKNCSEKIKQHPLKRKQINVYSPTSSTVFPSLADDCNIGSGTNIRLLTSSNVSAHLMEQAAGVLSENGSLVADIITPKKEFQQRSHSERFSSPVVLDEDLDETILKEIDALCEQHSTAKKVGHRSRVELSIELESKVCYESSADAPCSSGSAITEKLPEDGNVREVTATDLMKDGCSVKEVTQKVFIPKAYSEYIQSLNEMQKEAACCDILTPLMIVAGPGSGKTSTMVGRILKLLHEGINPTNILAMTFTTAAASEMRDRIGAVLGKAIAKELNISTFHSFCLQLCRSHAEKLGRTTEFLIYGHGQQRRAIIEAVRLTENAKKGRHDFGNFELDREFSVGVGNAQSFKDKSKKWQKFVTQAKASGKSPAEVQAMGDEIGAAILGYYNDILRSCNALDYHDFISLSVKLLTDFPEVYEECQGAWKAIVVDEFQDTSSMQYRLLCILAAHNCITVIGDEDQSIFSFNGANTCGFDSFRKDFALHREIRLYKNYRSTRCIVEAASSLIHHNVKRSELKQVVNDNSSDSKITIKECHNEDAQCAFVVDKILEITSDKLATKSSFSNIAVLYRRQVSGRAFQASFRSRKIPFNVHGVAFYRKKVVKAVMAMLRTSLPGCDDGPFRQAFKILLPSEKEEKKKVIGYIDKIAFVRKCSFLSAACDIFGAKISGTLKRSQLIQGRKVLFTLDMISKLVQREQSISVVITSVVNVVPQKYLVDQRAVVDVEGGRFLNEDSDLRSVLQYLLDDVSDFLSTHTCIDVGRESQMDGKGCSNLLKSFLDYISPREAENFRNRRLDNKNSVTLTTIHQANDSEIPLLHEFNGAVKENGSTLEEERRLLYVAMTRARRKLYILYVIMDSNWQLLQPSRFFKEIPSHLLEIQAELTMEELPENAEDLSKRNVAIPADVSKNQPLIGEYCPIFQTDCVVPNVLREVEEASNGNVFLKRFNRDDRATISHLFHQWAKKPAFHDPRRLLDKVSFVVDERLRLKASKNKDVLRALKSCLKCDDAFQYAQHVLRWEQMPADRRAHLTREKQEYFQKQRIENSMVSAAATSKQIAYLQSLGCTIVPTSRLHASRLIEEYKSL